MIELFSIKNYRIKVIKKLIVAIIFLNICCTMIGCKHTPNEKIVYESDSKKFEEIIMIKNDDNQSYDYLNHYHDEFLSKDGRVSISLNAEIETPTVNKLPVIKISPSPISDEKIRWAVDKFTEGNLGFYPTIYMNRSEAELLKINLQAKLMDEDKLYEECSSVQKVERVKENLAQTIKSLDEYYNRENPEQLKIQATLDLRPFAFYKHGVADIIEKELNMTQSELEERRDSKTNLYLLFDTELSNGKYVRLGIYNEYPYNLTTNNGESMFGLAKSQIHVVWSNISMNIHPIYILQSLPFTVYLPFGSLDMYYPDITRTMTESTNIAIDTLDDLGINNFYVESTKEEMGIDIMYRYCDSMESGNQNYLKFDEYSKSIEADAKFHNITFKPYYYGVPLLEANQILYNGEMYYSPMEYEVISIRMAEDCIAEFRWTNPTDISNVLNDNVKIISLETAIERAKQFMVLTYNLPTLLSVSPDMPDYDEIIKSCNNANVTIDTIKLGLAGIPSYDSVDEYLLIPVWNFYGSYSVQSDLEQYNDNVEDKRAPFVSVNAIDGSIIHQISYITYD